MNRVHVAAIVIAVAAGAAGCAQILAFEQKAAPVIARACSDFHRAEANPLVQLALAGGAAAATMATGVPVGSAVALVKSYGDAFCADGPPVGDTTTPEQQAAWLVGIVDKMLTAAK